MQDQDTELLLDEPVLDDDQEAEEQPDLSGDDLILDDEPEIEEGADLPNHLRKELREAQKERALLRKRVAEFEEREAPVLEDVSDEPPDMADFDFDQAAWKQATKEWQQKSVKVALQKANTKTPDQAIQEEFKGDLDRYHSELSELPYADKDDVLTVAQQALPHGHQVTLVQVAKNPGKLQYALGKSPALMESLLAIKSPIKLAAELVRIEEKLNMRSQKKPPAPASTIKGNATAPSADKTLAKLEKEAADTGNRTKLVKYKKDNNLL